MQLDSAFVLGKKNHGLHVLKSTNLFMQLKKKEIFVAILFLKDSKRNIT